MGRWALALVGAVIGAALGWQVVRQVNWGIVWDALLDYPPGLFVLGLVVILASTYVRALRWRLLYQDPRVRTVRLFLIENAAIGLNNVSPVRVLSEPTQVGLLSLRDRLSPGEVVATLGITRTLDLIVTIVALAVALFLIPVLRPFYPLLGVAAVASAIGIAALFIVALGSAKVPLTRRLRVAQDVRLAITFLRERPARVLSSLALTTVQWGLVVLCAWLVSYGTSRPLGVAETVAVMLGSIFFATSVPGLPAAFGTFEFAVVELMALVSVDVETAITFGILMRVLFFVPQMVFAVIVLPREGVGSIGAIRNLMARWERG